MAASYHTGTSSSPTNLLQTLVTWLTGQGWGVDLSAAIEAGWRAHLHKNGLYVNLRAAMDEKIWPREAEGLYHDCGEGGYGIGLYLGNGYSGGAEWHNQSGRPVRVDGTTVGAGANLPAGSVAAYHLFDDGNDHIAVVVERSPGIFCHFGWGPAMAAVGQPETFPYFYGSSSAYMNTLDTAPPGDRHGINVTALPPMSHGDRDYSSYESGVQMVHTTAMVRVDAGTFSGRWVGNGNWNDKGYGYSGRFMRCACNVHPDTQGTCDEGKFPGYQYLRSRVHQAAFAGGLLLPLHCYVLTDPGARWAPLGYPPSVFWCEAVGHGFAAGQIYQVGGLDYMLFPHFAVRKAA